MRKQYWGWNAPELQTQALNLTVEILHSCLVVQIQVCRAFPVALWLGQANVKMLGLDILR